MNLCRTGIVESLCIQYGEIVPFLVIPIQAIRKFLIQANIDLIQLRQFIQGMIIYLQWNQFIRGVGPSFTIGGTLSGHSGNAKEALHCRSVFRITQPFEDHDEVYRSNFILAT